MLLEPICPVCQQKSWEILAVKEYRQPDMPNDDYNRVRSEVLFELWFPGDAVVRLESILCVVCGFLCYQPRPENQDIDKKYSYISQHEQAGKEFSSRKASDFRRSQELYNYLRGYLSDKNSSILDYGGGNGRLLHRFVEQGYDCSIIELVDETLPGIKYAGSSASEVSDRAPYDLVILSHVLEHVVEPLETMKSLAACVADSGYIYVEVPSELWRKTPPSIDPVTHINFFTTDSLRTCLERSGLEVIKCHYQAFTRPNTMTGLAVKAVARRRTGTGSVPCNYGGERLALSLINAGTLTSIARLLRHPRLLANLYRKPK